jgi:hypothetical protein
MCRRPREAGPRRPRRRPASVSGCAIGVARGCGAGEGIGQEEELEVCGGWGAPPARGAAAAEARADGMGIDEDVKSEAVG